MEWKCNSFDCQHTFYNNITDEKIEQDSFDFSKVKCTKCNDPNNGCYLRKQ